MCLCVFLTKCSKKTAPPDKKADLQELTVVNADQSWRRSKTRQGSPIPSLKKIHVKVWRRRPTYSLKIICSPTNKTRGRKLTFWTYLIYVQRQDSISVARLHADHEIGERDGSWISTETVKVKTSPELKRHTLFTCTCSRSKSVSNQSEIPSLPFPPDAHNLPLGVFIFIFFFFRQSGQRISLELGNWAS